MSPGAGVHLGQYLHFSFPVSLGWLCWVPVLSKARGHVEVQHPRSCPHEIFWEGRADVRRVFTLFHPHRKTQGMGTWGGPSFPCSIPTSPPWMEETSTDSKHRFSHGFPWERAAPRGERRGILGLRTQLPSQRLSEVPALQPGVLRPHPSSHLSQQGDVSIPPHPFSAPPGARRVSVSPQHPKSCRNPADTPWPLQHSVSTDGSPFLHRFQAPEPHSIPLRQRVPGARLWQVTSCQGTNSSGGFPP